MNKDLKYTGYTANPSGYDSPDGDLDAAINLLAEDPGGSLRPLPSPQLRLMTGHSSLYSKDDLPQAALIHTVPTGKNYIIITRAPSQPARIYWLPVNAGLDQPQTDADALPLAPDVDFSGLKDILPMGNFLIVSTASATHYIIWDAQSSVYNYLGTQIPDIDLSFALTGDIVSRNFNSKLKLVDSLVTKDEVTWRELTSATFDKQASITDSTEAIATYYTDWIDLPENILLEDGKEYMLTVAYTQRGAAAWLELRGFYLFPMQVQTITTTTQNGKTMIFTVPEFKGGLGGASGGVKNLQFRIRLVNFNYSPSYNFNWPDHQRVAGRVSLSQAAVSRTELSDEDKSRLKRIEYSQDSYQAVSAAINKFIASEATSKNKFIYPFFVRYAVRLYDDSHINISEPILLIPNSSYVPFISFRSDNPQLALRAFVASLQYRINTEMDTSIWRDIISGIDIFVSQSAWPYDQGGEYSPDESNFTYAYPPDIACNGHLRLIHANAEVSGGEYRTLSLYEKIGDFFDTASYQAQVLRVGEVSGEDFIKKLTSISNYYLFSSIPLDKINRSENFVTADADEGVLSTLVTRRTLSQESLPYSGFAGASLFSYNNRLHIFDASYRLPQTKLPDRFNSHISPTTVRQSGIKMLVQLRTQHGQRNVVLQSESTFEPDPLKWFFYPDSRAIRAIIIVTDSGGSRQSAVLELKTHDFLNGAYWIAPSLEESIQFDPVADDDPNINAFDKLSPDTLIPAGSTVYPSDTANPFLFRSAAVVPVGSGRVLGLSSAAQALSQGQFGQFPLYAFTTEGVWAVETSADGLYIARQPITRDVCLNTAAITQLDNAVLFPSDRGIMLISGSQTQCISDAINSAYLFDALRKLPGFPRLHAMLGHDPETDSCLPLLGFPDFLRQCRMIYDYEHQRLIIYAPTVTCAYVYSLKSHTWGMTYSNIAAHLNSYPEALAVDRNHNVISYSGACRQEDGIKCLYLTRPLKLDIPDIHKTVDNIIQRGNFRKGHVSTVLYGSRDLINWHLIWSSKDHYLRGFRGTPYKYFRIAAVATLDADESISGASVQFTPHLTNQPR